METKELENIGNNHHIHDIDYENVYNTIISLDQLEEVYRSHLGKDGTITQAFKIIPTLDPIQKKIQGAQLSDIKKLIQELYDAKKQQLETQQLDQQLRSEIIDIHMNKPAQRRGHYHLLAQMRRDVEENLRLLGFDLEYGNELVTTHENFELVNIPMTHPATEMHDTLYADKMIDGYKTLLRTHTTAYQNHVLQKYGPVCKVATLGKVYRNEKKDATHDTMFWQLDGVVVDKNISIAHFKGSIQTILSSLLQKDITIRLRPSYFPFTEPSFEIDVQVTPADGNLWTLSKQTGRIELLGAGMVHHTLLTNAGIDPTQYSGFAFGIGLSRLVAIKHNIHDIRLLTGGDLRFVQSF